MNETLFIEIGFENLDNIRIPTDYFKDFSMEDITVTLRELPWGERELDTKVGRTTFTLYPSVEAAARHFEGDWFHGSSPWGALYTRLCQNDITSITLHRESGGSFVFYVVWEDAPDSIFQNQYQAVTRTQEGYCVSIQQP